MGKTVAESATEMVEMVLPNDANPLGNLLGGKVMHLIDIAGAISAHRHARSQVVTVAVDNLDFLYPIRVGELVVLRAHITRTFRTSMEAEVRVYREDYLTGKRQQTNSAFVTYVALDPTGKPQEIPPADSQYARKKSGVIARRSMEAPATPGSRRAAHRRYFEKA